MNVTPLFPFPADASSFCSAESRPDAVDACQVPSHSPPRYSGCCDQLEGATLGLPNTEVEKWSNQNMMIGSFLLGNML